MRVSAPSRRGAAPYADGSLSSQTPSHLISLSILGVPEEFRPEFYKEFCVRHNGAKSTLWYPRPLPSIEKCPIQRDLAPTYPSPLTPRRNPGPDRTRHPQYAATARRTHTQAHVAQETIGYVKLR